MSKKRNNRLPMVDILMANGGAAMAKAGTLVGSGNALGITEGQLGVMSADFHGTLGYGSFLTGGETASDIRAIKVIQGTSASADITTADLWEVGEKAYRESGVIAKDQVRSVTEFVPKPAEYGATALTDIAAPADLTDYGMLLNFWSRRLRKEYGANGARESFNFTTPDYTTLGTVDPTDHLLQNIAAKMNTASNQFNGDSGKQTGRMPFVVFAVNNGGGAGTAITSIVAGDTVDVMTVDGKTTSYTFTYGAVAALAGLIKATEDNADATDLALLTATIEEIDLSTAGSAANVDALIVLALEDPIQLGVDTETTKLVRIDVNPKAGFRVAGGFVASDVMPNEAKNLGRNWSIENRERAQRDVHNLWTNTDYAALNMSEGANNVVGNVPYAGVSIDYYDYEDTLTITQDEPKQLVVLFEAAFDLADDVATVNGLYDASSNIGNPAYPQVAGSTVAQIQTDYIAILRAWLASNDGAVVETAL